MKQETKTSHPSVLIVDDDNVITAVVGQHLAAEGLEFESAASGDAAWKRLTTESSAPPRLLLLDWMMPGELDGPALCRKIRRHPRLRDCYIVLMTGRDRPEDLLHGLDAGADDFIAKPLDYDDLLARVEVGLEALQSSHSTSRDTVKALAEALQAGTGEVVVRKGSTIGRIYVVDRQIAWAHVSSDPGSLTGVLGEESKLGPEEVQEVLGESRRTGKSPTSILLQWGLVEQAHLRDRLRTWLERKIRILLSLKGGEALFVPENHRYEASELTFSLEELLPDLVTRMRLRRKKPGESTPTAVSAGTGTTEWTLTEPRADLAACCRHLIHDVPEAQVAAIFDTRKHVVLAYSPKGMDVLSPTIRAALALFEESLGETCNELTWRGESEIRLFQEVHEGIILMVQTQAQALLGAVWLVMRLVAEEVRTAVGPEDSN